MRRVPQEGTHPQRRYGLISPCRNEEAFVRATLEAIARQTMLPALWVVVDDGSTDRTPDILAEYRSRLPFMRVMKLEDRGSRRLGGGVVEAFEAGLSQVDLRKLDYVCKMDMDLDLPDDYFERLILKMEADPLLGTCSGKPHYVDKYGRERSEYCGSEMSVGMTKFYRTACYSEIGGFVAEVGWDIVDCHRCRMLGWRARAFDDAELSFEHLRPMGSSHKSIWHGRLRHGRGQHFMGTHILFMLASVVYRLNKPPVFVGAMGMFLGYLRAAVTRSPRLEDAELRRWIRAYQWKALAIGKMRAAEEMRQLAQARRRGERGLEERGPRACP